MYTTWITKKEGKVDDVCQMVGDKSPVGSWEKVPNDWDGNPKDDLAWFDADMRRIPDEKLVELGIRKDCRGTWYNKITQERKNIYSLDEEVEADWTTEIPLNEPYQKWDEESGAWIIDTEKKEEAEKNQKIAEKKSAIAEAENRIQRSLRAKLDGTATEEDETYFTQINAEINLLREDLKQLTAA
jgi:hypothetical protein